MENNMTCDDCRSQKVEQLFSAFCVSADLQQLVELSSQAFGFPIYITDSNYKLLAISSCGDYEDDVWSDTAALGYLSSRIIADAISIHKPNKPMRYGEHIHFTWKSRISSYPMLIYYIYHNGILLGHISALCVHGEPTEMDYYLVGRLNELLAKYLSTVVSENGINTKPYESILTALIETDRLDVATLENRALATGLSIYNEFCLLNISFESDFSSIKERLIKTFPLNQVFYYDFQLMLLFPQMVHVQQNISDAQLERIKSIADMENAYVCISDKFHSISELGVHYRKNKRILEISRLYRKAASNQKLLFKVKILEDRILIYDQFKHIDMILRSAKADRAEDLYQHVSNPIREIYEYDVTNGTDTLRTLMIYMECQGSYIRTAEKMFTHKNTIAYRIEKLKQKYSLDLSDSDVLLNSHFSCVLLQLHMLINDM